ncbi:cytochrome P450 [Mycena polygramma]|nr:cytochrome P450 [Mycena polygramma]
MLSQMAQNMLTVGYFTWGIINVYSGIIGFLGYFCSMTLYRLSPFHRLHRFPGPMLWKISELPILYYAIRGTQHNAVKILHDRYGCVVQIGPNTLSFKSATAIRQIYGSSQALEKSVIYDFHSIKGDGVFFTRSKKTHSFRRRIINRAFSEHAITGYQATMVLTVEHLIRHLVGKTKEMGEIDLTESLPRYSYDTINAIFFSGTAFQEKTLLDSGDPENIVWHGAAYFKAFELASHLWPMMFHLVKNIPGYSTVMRFELFAQGAARRRLVNEPVKPDGISRWLIDEEGRPTLDVKNLPIESATILLGGADTMGGACVHLIYFLLTNPKWHKLVRAELEDSIPEKDVVAHLQALESCTFLNAFIHESLRLSAPLPGVPRVVPPEGMLIDGYFVPGGTTVGVPIWTHHMDDTYFSRPDTFDPSRWIENAVFKPGATLFVFSAGPFGCAGTKFTYVQLRIFLAMLVLRVDIVSTAGFNGKKFWSGIRNCRSTTFEEALPVKVVLRDYDTTPPIAPEK